MRINEATNKIDASYNTIKKFIEKNQDYYEIRKSIMHITEKGMEELEKKYGLKSEVLTEDNIVFYKAQINLLLQQVEDYKNMNDVFINQLEQAKIEDENNIKRVKNMQKELLNKELKIKELEHEKDLKIKELEYELETEKNKSFFSKLFRK